MAKKICKVHYNPINKVQKSCKRQDCGINAITEASLPGVPWPLNHHIITQMCVTIECVTKDLLYPSHC